MNQPASPYDSHPSPTDRFSLVRALPTVGTISSTDEDEAWTLFVDRVRIEQEMTDIVRANLKEQSGVEIPAMELAPSAPQRDSQEK